MESLVQFIRSMGFGRMLAIGIILIAVITFFVFIVSRVTNQNLGLLYSNLDIQDSSRITQILSSENVPYEIQENGARILINNDDIGRMRMLLADRGLPGSGSVGYEIFDDSSTIGTTNFVQNINLVRALEGELARTIQTISSVNSARVHLVFPKRELFSRQKRQASASVILRMGSNATLENAQIASIRNLVANAVPGLVPNRVAIIDNSGKMLASGTADASDPAYMTNKITEQRRIAENKMAHTIEDLLEKSVGFGKVRAEVSLDLDFDRINTTEEIFDPEGQVARSTQTIEQNSDAEDMDIQENVSVELQLPDSGDGTQNTLRARENENRVEETVNFEISKKIINHVREVGSIRRISVAVLVDGERAFDENNQSVYTPRDDAELENLATLVRSAIGYDPDRGDVVNVVNMEFVDFIPPVEPIAFFLGLERQDVVRLVEMIVIALITIAVIMLIVRPILSRTLEGLSIIAAASADQGEYLVSSQPGGPNMIESLDGGSSIPSPDGDLDDEDTSEDLIDVDRIEGQLKASSVRRIGEIIDNHPEQALSIIRQWMSHE